MGKFSLEGYKELLSSLQNLGYVFVEGSFCDDRKNEISLKHRECFLRHDVDTCVDSALEIAQLERSLGISSSFFFLVNTSIYNCLGESEVKKIRKIRSLGHSVALHVDFWKLGSDDLDLLTQIQSQVAIFGAVGIPTINLVSFHRPDKCLLRSPKIGPYFHTYQPEFLDDCVYRSDSKGLFRYGHPLDCKEIVVEKRGLHLLIHPEWWVYQVLDPAEKAQDMVVAAQKRIRQHISYNCSVVKPHD